MTSNGRGEDLEATLNQGLHRHFRHKNANHFPPPRQSDSSPNPSQPQPSPGISPESEDEYMPILEEFMDRNTGASRHRRQMSSAYRGVEYALSPTLKSPSIVFPRNPSPLSPQYYQRPAYQPQTPIHDVVHLRSPSPLYSRTQAFRYSQQKHKPAPLRLQADSPTLGHWTQHQPPPSPSPIPFLFDATDDADDSDDEFPIRPSAALLPHKEQATTPPRRRLPDLLQDVLGIMESITSQQSQLEEESLALQDMVELVMTIQEQTDSLMEYSDLVEEYVDVVNDAVGLVDSPSSAYSIDTFDVQEEIENGEDVSAVDRGARELASRADSGVSVGDDTSTDLEDPLAMEDQPQAIPSVRANTPAKAKATPKEPPFRDSGLGLMSPDMATPGKGDPKLKFDDIPAYLPWTSLLASIKLSDSRTVNFREHATEDYLASCITRQSTRMTASTEDSWPQKMRAWTYSNASGGLENALQLQNGTAPPPKTLLGKDSVLVHVSHMSLNPADYKVPELGLLSKLVIPVPASPGMDYSGTVAAVGSDVKAYQPGQKVFGRVEPIKNRYGALAEYIVAKDGEAIAAAPAGWEDRMDQLACIGTCGLTALQSIEPYATAGDKVFINGGSGGTGTFGIQIAKALGLHVTVSCSGANAELCRGLGADEVIDYKGQNVGEVLKAKGKVFKLVVDNVGYTPPGQEDLYTAANTFMVDDGQFVQVGGGVSASQIKSVVTRSFVPGFLGGGKRKFNMVVTKQSTQTLTRIGEWMKEGKVKAVTDETFQYEDAPKAYAKLKTGRAKGKIVVVVTK